MKLIYRNRYVGVAGATMFWPVLVWPVMNWAKGVHVDAA